MAFDAAVTVMVALARILIPASRSMTIIIAF
jgi:hypothetical protein